MQLIQDKFSLIKTGSNSKVYRYGDKDSGVVLKVVPASCQKQAKHMLNQYKLLKKLTHQNIITVLKYKEGVKLNGIDSKSQLGLFNVLVLEQAHKGNLLDFYKRNSLTLPQIKFIFLSICNAVQFLHCNYISHRDLKLQNILVFQSQDEIVVKLADFGFASTIFDGTNIKTFNSFKGTKRGYMAPEIHQCLKKQNTYQARKSDCFALGVILFSLVLGKLPFQFGNKQNKLYNLISEKQYDQFWAYHAKQLENLQIQNCCSMISQFKQLFVKMVAYDVEQRYTVEDIIEDQYLKNGLVTLMQAKNFK